MDRARRVTGGGALADNFRTGRPYRSLVDHMKSAGAPLFYDHNVDGTPCHPMNFTLYHLAPCARVATSSAQQQGRTPTVQLGSGQPASLRQLCPSRRC